jgi:hypothetical protein
VGLVQTMGCVSLEWENEGRIHVLNLEDGRGRRGVTLNALLKLKLWEESWVTIGRETERDFCMMSRFHSYGYCML